MRNNWGTFHITVISRTTMYTMLLKIRSVTTSGFSFVKFTQTNIGNSLEGSMSQIKCPIHLQKICANWWCITGYNNCWWCNSCTRPPIVQWFSNFFKYLEIVTQSVKHHTLYKILHNWFAGVWGILPTQNLDHSQIWCANFSFCPIIVYWHGKYSSKNRVSLVFTISDIKNHNWNVKC